MMGNRKKNILGWIINGGVSFFVLTISTFMIGHIAPGDPLYAIYGESAQKISSAHKKIIMENLGLDKSLMHQYRIWLLNFLKGDFGVSFKYNMPVEEIIKKAFGNTLFLGLSTLISIIIIAIFLGFLCALNQGRLIDMIITKGGTFFYCIPSFWLSLMLILLFSVVFKLLPSSGIYDIGREGEFLNKVKHSILPWFIVFINHIGYYSNFVRDRVIEELKEEYLITAMSKGLSKTQILIKHVFRNILPSFITLVAISINHLISGSLLIEAIFSYPGIGKYVFESAKFHDYPLLMASIIIIGLVVIVSNLISDVLCEVLNPRMREEI